MPAEIKPPSLFPECRTCPLTEEFTSRFEIHFPELRVQTSEIECTEESDGAVMMNDTHHSTRSSKDTGYMGNWTTIRCPHFGGGSIIRSD